MGLVPAPPTVLNLEPGVVYVHLMGGLGNQLFQLAAGLSVVQSHQLVMVPTFGSPRGLGSNSTALGSLRLPTAAGISGLEVTRPQRWLLTRALNFQVRMSMSNFNSLNRDTLISLRQRTLGLSLRLLAGSSIPVLVGSGGGYDPRLLECDLSRGLLMVGYFQSWRYVMVGSVLETIRACVCSDSVSNELEDIRMRAKKVQPLVVHVRRGDYRNDKTLGILPREYYSDSIGHALKQGVFGEIWVYSDEPDTTKQLLSAVAVDVPVVFPEHEYQLSTSLEVLRAMALGHSFVISNSSFGWWAAMLGKSRDKRVFAPEPWFASRNDPRDLCPPSWERIPTRHSS